MDLKTFSKTIIKATRIMGVRPTHANFKKEDLENLKIECSDNLDGDKLYDIIVSSDKNYTNWIIDDIQFAYIPDSDSKKLEKFLDRNYTYTINIYNKNTDFLEPLKLFKHPFIDIKIITRENAIVKYTIIKFKTINKYKNNVIKYVELLEEALGLELDFI